jgi:microcystin-dependent protein
MSVTQASLLGDTFGSKASGTIPVGGIIMWSGSIVSIPTGWALCNGSNGTPNLVDRFIVGAGSGYGVAATGGSANATLVAHTHTITDPGHSHTYTRPVTNFSQRTDLDDNMFYYREGTLNTQSNTTGITINSSGSSETNANLPPYYALAFIMRTS